MDGKIKNGNNSFCLFIDDLIQSSKSIGLASRQNNQSKPTDKK